ncbi:MAG: CCE_0567 family metalloprotein [Accumulibacter sp.]|jgi:hypothetical protein|uniref:CCE_0567 family metalloprotein n=1 Tax=Accumulibacter sp. TaxID=2053492 RepID=UPI002FC31526
MSNDELRELDREVKRLKRLAGEQAARLHDLVEERLPAAWPELPEISQATLLACQAWAEANARLQVALKG